MGLSVRFSWMIRGANDCHHPARKERSDCSGQVHGIVMKFFWYGHETPLNADHRLPPLEEMSIP